MLSDIDTSEHAAARPDFVKEALAAMAQMTGISRQTLHARLRAE
ncbi:hypothetical protein ABZS83_05360 [Streptomyces sp. NPDC005426]